MAKPRSARQTRTSDQFPGDPTSQYAADVVAGRIIAGEHHVAAAERHLRDLKDGEGRGLYWRPEIAAHAINFPPAVLSITAGAHEGRPFNLLPHLLFCTGSLFGWRTASGRMRFRSGWVETGKGQAKSPWMAATGLYMGGFYGVRRAEVYSIGQDRKTANVLFRDAVAMCRANIPGADEDELDTLESRGEVVIRGEFDNAWKIEFPDSGSVFQSLANGESISGPRPTLVAADEIHEFKSNSSIETWKAAIAKMPGDALMLLGTNTPASTQIVGTEYSEFYQKVALLESRAFNVEDVCRWFDTPPILVGHTSKSQTMFGSGVEQIMLGWVTLDLDPLLSGIEQAIDKQLLSAAERKRYFAEYNREALLQADSQAKAAFLSQMVQNGIMTRAEARAKMNLGHIQGSDQLTAQTNLAPLEMLGQQSGGSMAEQQIRSAFMNLLFGGDLEAIIEQRVKAAMKREPIQLLRIEDKD